jgi:hypothetical protein
VSEDIPDVVPLVVSEDAPLIVSEDAPLIVSEDMPLVASDDMPVVESPEAPFIGPLSVPLVVPLVVSPDVPGATPVVDPPSDRLPLVVVSDVEAPLGVVVSAASDERSRFMLWQPTPKDKTMAPRIALLNSFILYLQMLFNCW